MKEMFKKVNIIIPPELSLRRKVNDMGNTMKIFIGQKIEGKNFLSFSMKHNLIIENLDI